MPRKNSKKRESKGKINCRACKKRHSIKDVNCPKILVRVNRGSE